MPSKYNSPSRYIQPDPRYKSILVTKFCNCVMQDGKKRAAYKIFYDAMDEIGRRVKDREPLEVFQAAIANVKPLIQVRSRRVGGATYQVPMEVQKKRQTTLAIRWLLDATRKKKGRPMFKRLADELVMAYRREGAAMSTRDQVHKMAEANKAFAHLSW
jgi:small subunit ribosomal protein S7